MIDPNYSIGQGCEGAISNQRMREYLRLQQSYESRPGYFKRTLPSPQCNRLSLVDASDYRRALEQQGMLFRDRDIFITHVRGFVFNDLRQLEKHVGEWVVLDLNPEPDNPYDPLAIAVDFQGVRVGYLSAGVAAPLQWDIRLLQKCGWSVAVKGFVLYRIFHPTGARPVSGVRLIVPKQRILRGRPEFIDSLKWYRGILKQYWGELDEESRSSILSSNCWRNAASEEQVRVFCDKIKHDSNSLLPANVATGPIPGEILKFLFDIRNDFSGEGRDI
ncbi:HIRAN domain-containing protein [Actinomyces capricornis]|uniref:HIRAN domain-containing protein n=1 Tax=Actinomyces capricornis TaxID=2755559 RepID=A0ABN6KCA0_9ACTO|nr:HIRAN domain-containing protein [Actinomyces capricornis]BDA65664.1 hypothetical protein MANAM107_24980 [Actinomyces capricornis]